MPPRCDLCKQFRGAGEHICATPGRPKSKTSRWYSEAGKEYRAEYQRRWRERNPGYGTRYYTHAQEERNKLRLETLEAYSNGSPSCACCGETQMEFLTLDHINGDGAAERKASGQKGGTHQYRVLRRQGFPPGFRVLCWNCNCALGMFNYCPHRMTNH